MSYLYLYSPRNLRGASAGVRVNKSASCAVCVVREEPVTDRRGSILQLVFTLGMTWRTERWCTAAHKAPPPPASRRPASTPLVMPLQRDRVGVCFALLQLCQCATGLRSHWLGLMEGRG